MNHGNVTMACVADIFPSEIINNQTNISHDQIDTIYFLNTHSWSPPPPSKKKKGVVTNYKTKPSYLIFFFKERPHPLFTIQSNI